MSRLVEQKSDGSDRLVQAERRKKTRNVVQWTIAFVLLVALATYAVIALTH